LLISERLNRKISVWVTGEKKNELLAIIRREIEYIHKTLNYPDVKEMIPCICSKCASADKPHFYNYQTLCLFRSKGKSKIACEKSTEDISIEKLLGDYERPEDKEKMERHYEDERVCKIEVSPHIEVSPKIEQKPVVETIKKRKWWKTPWAIVAGCIILLGGIWSAIQIYESKTLQNILKRLFGEIKTEQIEKKDVLSGNEMAK